MERAIDAVAPRRFTVEEYHRMAGAGILGPEERVELIRGIVREMSPKRRAHVIAVELLGSRVREALRGRASVYQEAPLVAKDLDSEPEPDLLVCSNPDRTAYGTTMTRALLVVEVAEASRAYDLGEKAALYAEAGVPEYWVVDSIERALVVFRELEAGRYRGRSSFGPGARIRPAAWPDVALEVSAFLPPDES